MREAAHLSVLGMEAAISAIEPDATEKRLSSAGSAAMMAAGSEFFSVEPIVRTGWRSGLVNATCKRRVIEVDDAVSLEIGGVYQRYFASVTDSRNRPPE